MEIGRAVLGKMLQQHCESLSLAPDCSLWLGTVMLLFPAAGMRANSVSSLLPAQLLWPLEPHSTEGLNFLSLFPKSMFPQYVWKPSYRNLTLSQPPYTV